LDAVMVVIFARSVTKVEDVAGFQCTLKVTTYYVLGMMRENALQG
jgi:hypothetical protein